jgi:hypothetical protein
MPLTNGSGSWIRFLLFSSLTFKDANKKLLEKKNLFCLLRYFLKVYLHHFSNIKSQKESQNSRNQGFSCYFCMMIERSGSGSIPQMDSEPDPGSPKPCGSGGSGSATLLEPVFILNLSCSWSNPTASGAGPLLALPLWTQCRVSHCGESAGVHLPARLPGSAPGLPPRVRPQQ